MTRIILAVTLGPEERRARMALHHSVMIRFAPDPRVVGLPVIARAVKAKGHGWRRFSLLREGLRCA